MTIINNLPVHAANKPYIVARQVNNEWWYWGCFSDAGKAFEIAEMLDNGWVFKTY
jgi:hypothetical protein